MTRLPVISTPAGPVQAMPSVLVDGDGNYAGIGPTTGILVPANSTDIPLGAAGATISRLVLQPATASPGAVTLKDGDAVKYAFPGGASSVADLAPMNVDLGLTAADGFTITTGNNISVLAIGVYPGPGDPPEGMA